jgi:hypothetical protein
MEHVAALDIKFQEDGYKFENKEYATFGRYKFTILKNHCGGSSGVSGIFKIWLDPHGEYGLGDTDDLAHVINYGRETGVITKTRGDYTFTTPYVEKGSLGFKTITSLEKFFRENPTIFSDVRRRVLDALMTYRSPATVEKTKKGKKDE